MFGKCAEGSKSHFNHTCGTHLWVWGVVLRTTNPPDIKEHTPAAAALAPFRGKEIANDKNNKASKHSQTSTFYWKSIFFI